MLVNDERYTRYAIHNTQYELRATLAWPSAAQGRRATNCHCEALKFTLSVVEWAAISVRYSLYAVFFIDFSFLFVYFIPRKANASEERKTTLID